MFNFLKTFEKAMGAAAFAEAGEFEYARQYLAGRKVANQKVLLGADDKEISPKVINHALSLCSRMESTLEIIQIFPPQALDSKSKLFEKQGRQLAAMKDKFDHLGILYQYAIRENTLIDELAAFTAKRRDILVVVLQQQFAKGKNNLSDLDIARYFNCPVALIEA